MRFSANSKYLLSIQIVASFLVAICCRTPVGDPTDIGSQEFSNMIVVNCKENDGIDTFYHRKMNNEVMIPPAGNS
jgi:hypothetical protein